MWPICPVVGVHVLLPNAKTASHKCLERLNPERTQLQQQLFHATEIGVTTPTVRNRLHVAQLRARRPSIVLPLNANHRQARRVWCRLHQRWTVTQWSNVMFSDIVEIRSRFSWWTAKGLESKWGALPASSHDRTRPLWRWKCRGLGRDHHDREDITLHLLGERHWALQQRQCHWAYCCALHPWNRAHRARVIQDYLHFRRFLTIPWPA